jgi:hypothetical protein
MRWHGKKFSTFNVTILQIVVWYDMELDDMLNDKMKCNNARLKGSHSPPCSSVYSTFHLVTLYDTQLQLLLFYCHSVRGYYNAHRKRIKVLLNLASAWHSTHSHPIPLSLIVGLHFNVYRICENYAMECSFCAFSPRHSIKFSNLIVFRSSLCTLWLIIIRAKILCCMR